MLVALSTGHTVGLAVSAAAFIAFALASSFVFPRFRPQYPGGGLLAFIVVAFVFFFGMLTAVEVFGAESGHEGKHAAETGTSQQPTTIGASAAQTISVSETEFKIAMPSTLKAGTVTFTVKNDGKIQHDLAIKGGAKTALIQPGASATLTTTLKPGKYVFYCTVPGHEQAGMKVNVTVTGAAAAPTTTTSAAAQSVSVSETEFKIAMPSTLKAGKVTFNVKNDGKIQHDLAIKGGSKTALIQPGASATLTVTLKPGKYVFYCTVPGHEQAGMKVNVTVTGAAAAQTTTSANTTTSAAAQAVSVSETEFKIAMPSTLKAGKVTFNVKNDGKIEHDLAIKGGPKTALIQPGASAQLTATLKAGKYVFYCTVPGHEQAGMKVDVTVS